MRPESEECQLIDLPIVQEMFESDTVLTVQEVAKEMEKPVELLTLY